jgi:hypothetical protein
MKTRPILLVAALALIPGAGAAAVLTPAADGSVRDGLHSPKDGTPDDVLENAVVQALHTSREELPFEDRGIIEFSLEGLSPPILRARLRLPVFGSMGPYPFRINVFAYRGDGQLALSDWKGGAFAKPFVYSNTTDRRVVWVNVTSAVRAAVTAGQRFIGFRFVFAAPSPIPLNGPFIAFNSLEHHPRGGVPTLRVNEGDAGGSLTGVVPEQVICRNMTTGQTVTINTDGDSWDCVEAGLDVRPGDQIMQTTTGPAE